MLLVNQISYVDLYKEKDLPRIRHFKKGSFGFVDMPEHFFERQQVRAEFKTEFNFQAYPFDKQILKIEISLDCPIYVAQFDKIWLATNRDDIALDNTCISALSLTEWTACRRNMATNDATTGASSKIFFLCLAQGLVIKSEKK